MQGKIVKGISGFYYVHVVQSGIYECRAKGIFRKQKKKPLVGDDVIFDVLDGEKRTGNITELLPRRNELIRPAVSNVDQALIIFAAAKPKPHFNLLDRFLVMMEYQRVPVVICFNKCDLITEDERSEIAGMYGFCKKRLLFTSAKEEIGLDGLREIIFNKTTAVAGPSGVGKSSLVNLLSPGAQMQTGEISSRIERGRHTTRHSELIHVGGTSYLMDTPGFSSLYIPGVEKEDLGGFYPEFAAYEPYCRFQGCAHISEPDCGVRRCATEKYIPCAMRIIVCSMKS